MKVELLKEKSREEIEQIWCEYHKKNDCVFACLSSEEFESQSERAKHYPMVSALVSILYFILNPTTIIIY